jgi:uncharacterized protein (TIGR03067 family)
MTRVAAPLLILALAAPPGRPAPVLKDRPATDSDLVGDWVLKSLTEGGVPARLGGLATQVEFTVDGDRIGRNRNGVIVSTARYRADRAPTPRTLDVWSADGPPTSRGVYALDVDTLTVFYVTDTGADRPAKLDAPAGSKVFMAVFERKK